MEDLVRIITTINEMPIYFKLFSFDMIVFLLFDVCSICCRKQNGIYSFFLYLRAVAIVITILYLLLPLWKIVMVIICIVGFYYLIRYIYRLQMSKKGMLYCRDIPKNYSVIEVISFMNKYYLFSKKKLIQAVLLDLKAKDKILIQEKADEINFFSMIQIAPFDDKLEQYVYNFIIDKNKSKYSMEELFYMAKEQLVQRGILRKKKAIEQIVEILIPFIGITFLSLISFLIAFHLEQYIWYCLLFIILMEIFFISSIAKADSTSNHSVGQQIAGIIYELIIFSILIFGLYIMPEISPDSPNNMIVILFPFILSPFIIKCIKLNLENYEYTPTKKGKKLAIELQALKRFFQDFSTLDEKSANDIIFWERYLSFAYALDVNTNYGDLGNQMQLMRADERKHYFAQIAYLIGELISAKTLDKDVEDIKKIIKSRKEKADE